MLKRIRNEIFSFLLTLVVLVFVLCIIFVALCFVWCKPALKRINKFIRRFAAFVKVSYKKLGAYK